MLQPGQAKYLTIDHDECVNITVEGANYSQITLDKDYAVLRVGVVDMAETPSTQPYPIQLDPTADEYPAMTLAEGTFGFVGATGARMVMTRPNEPLRELASPGGGVSVVSFGPHGGAEYLPDTLVFCVEGYDFV